MKTRKNLNIFLVMLLFLLATLCAAAKGGTLYVPSVYSNIQDAIDAAVSGVDQIEVAPGTYNENIDFNGKAIRLYSRDGAAATTIDGGGIDTVVKCLNKEGADTILQGFTITAGYSAFYGGGMRIEYDSSPTVTNCIFIDNVADWGGAGMVIWIDSNPSVTGCTFSNNSAQWGGGIFNQRSSPTVTDCTFSGNSVSGPGGAQGGGMYNWESCSPTVTNCTFTDNVAGGGGGMHNGEDCNPTLIDCTFSNNSAGTGGGMHNWKSSPIVIGCTFSGNSGCGMRNKVNSSPTVTSCTFTNNSTGGSGGGMCNTENSNPEVTDCTFSGNFASYWGGGVHNWQNSPTMTNCTFTGNISQWGGGGMHNSDSSPTVTNCTLTGNSASSGGGMENNNSNSTVTNCILWGDIPNEIYIPGGTLVISYSDVQGGTGQPWFGTGCIDTDPTFADSYGRLSAGSPCIDAGDNSAVTVSTDLDGNSRIVGLAVDMGAYEFQEPTQHAAAKTEQLIDEVVVLNLQEGIESSLDTKLDAVSQALDDVNTNNDVAAINALQAFINSVEAQRGKKITNEQANELIAAAQQIIDLLKAE